MNLRPALSSLLATAALLGAALPAQAQAPAAPAVPQYGANVNYEQARRALAAAIADARRLNIPMAVAVVDTAGLLVAFERMDNTQTGSVAVAQDKAMSAAMFRRPTKVFQDAVAGGGAGLRILTLRGASAVEGGLPLVVDGRIIGGIGVSGGSAEQDGEVARAAVGALGR
ncbi:GlcG/HbpS family heme-binding protein [Ramlibacter montanisoli]|uniref:Heme-binding protein n=1 Tax=Ramlibacter montanisoli TaxID=2732512 RepID=A0A849KFE0_9BURK|nr:heme-binding protein [Ramlibacter montanisoli]NNU42913.1 heme-binding protein [Ramlibacter montanisoli]